MWHGSHNFPLHLILHDEWFRNGAFADGFRKPSNRFFREVYERAASRLCVSPYMEESYRKSYGSKGTIFYPSRSHNAIVHTSPPDRLLDEACQPVAMYAGNIFQVDYLKSMQCVADVLATVGGKLVLYTSRSKADCMRDGFDSRQRGVPRDRRLE